MVYITDNLCTKNGNSSFFKPKIRGLYTRAVTDQERVIVARTVYNNVMLLQKLVHFILYYFSDLSNSNLAMPTCFLGKAGLLSNLLGQ